MSARRDLPELKAAAADHGFDLAVSDLLPPGWAGIIYTPPPGYEDDLGPVVVVRALTEPTPGAGP